jgi:hypothetical protein
VIGERHAKRRSLRVVGIPRWRKFCVFPVDEEATS